MQFKTSTLVTVALASGTFAAAVPNPGPEAEAQVDYSAEDLVAALSKRDAEARVPVAPVAPAAGAGGERLSNILSAGAGAIPIAGMFAGSQKRDLEDALVLNLLSKRDADADADAKIGLGGALGIAGTALPLLGGLLGGGQQKRDVDEDLLLQILSKRDADADAKLGLGGILGIAGTALPLLGGLLGGGQQQQQQKRDLEDALALSSLLSKRDADAKLGLGGILGIAGTALPLLGGLLGGGQQQQQQQKRDLEDALALSNLLSKRDADAKLGLGGILGIAGTALPILGGLLGGGQQQQQQKRDLEDALALNNLFSKRDADADAKIGLGGALGIAGTALPLLGGLLGGSQQKRDLEDALVLNLLSKRDADADADAKIGLGGALGIAGTALPLLGGLLGGSQQKRDLEDALALSNLLSKRDADADADAKFSLGGALAAGATATPLLGMLVGSQQQKRDLEDAIVLNNLLSKRDVSDALLIDALSKRSADASFLDIFKSIPSILGGLLGGGQ